MLCHVDQLCWRDAEGCSKPEKDPDGRLIDTSFYQADKGPVNACTMCQLLLR